VAFGEMDLISGVAFGEMDLISGVAFGEMDLISGVAFGEMDLIRGLAFGEMDLTSGVAFGEMDLIRGLALVNCSYQEKPLLKVLFLIAERETTCFWKILLQDTCISFHEIVFSTGVVSLKCLFMDNSI
jgi:hypothetical protein